MNEPLVFGIAHELFMKHWLPGDNSLELSDMCLEAAEAFEQTIHDAHVAQCEECQAAEDEELDRAREKKEAMEQFMKIFIKRNDFGAH